MQSIHVLIRITEIRFVDVDIGEDTKGVPLEAGAPGVLPVLKGLYNLKVGEEEGYHSLLLSLKTELTTLQILIHNSSSGDTHNHKEQYF